MTEATGNQPSNLSAEALSKMSHADLVILRDKETDTDKQNLISPYEHRAFAREYVGDGNVVTSAAKAVGVAAAIPAYQVKKLIKPEESRSGASVDQMTEAAKGVVEGVVEPWKRLWNDSVNKVTEIVTGKPVEAITAPTAPWDKSWGGSRDMSKIMAPTPVKPSDFKATLASFTPKLEKLESSGNPNADNPESTALGLHQFTDATWKGTVKSMGKDYSLADRTDPAKSREVFAFFTEQNAKKAEKDLGRTPAEHELYAYHLLGRTGGGDLLAASPTASATTVVGEKRAKKNAGLFYKDPKTKEQPRTVAEVLQVFKEKFK